MEKCVCVCACVYENQIIISMKTFKKTKQQYKTHFTESTDINDQSGGEESGLTHSLTHMHTHTHTAL